MTLRVVQVGAGGMGRAWLSTVAASQDVELVGIVDLDLDVARAGAELAGDPSIPVGRSLTELAAETGAQAVLDITVPVAHHPITMEALHAGLPVLGEKPAAQTVAEALSLAAAAEATGQLFMVSQSRRYNDHLVAFRQHLRDLGEPRHAEHPVRQGPALRRLPRGDGRRPAARHGDPPVRLRPVPARAGPGVGLLRVVQPLVVLVPRRRGGRGGLHLRGRHPVRLRRLVVRSRSGDLVERRLAGLGRGRGRTLGRRPRADERPRRHAGLPRRAPRASGRRSRVRSRPSSARSTPGPPRTARSTATS